MSSGGGGRGLYVVERRWRQQTAVFFVGREADESVLSSVKPSQS